MYNIECPSFYSLSAKFPVNPCNAKQNQYCNVIEYNKLKNKTTTIVE